MLTSQSVGLSDPFSLYLQSQFSAGAVQVWPLGIAAHASLRTSPGLNFTLTAMFRGSSSPAGMALQWGHQYSWQPPDVE